MYAIGANAFQRYDTCFKLLSNLIVNTSKKQITPEYQLTLLSPLLKFPNQGLRLKSASFKKNQEDYEQNTKPSRLCGAYCGPKLQKSDRNYEVIP